MEKIHLLTIPQLLITGLHIMVTLKDTIIPMNDYHIPQGQMSSVESFDQTLILLQKSKNIVF
jgi:hypothetical protein